MYTCTQKRQQLPVFFSLHIAECLVYISSFTLWGLSISLSTACFTAAQALAASSQSCITSQRRRNTSHLFIILGQFFAPDLQNIAIATRAYSLRFFPSLFQEARQTQLHCYWRPDVLMGIRSPYYAMNMYSCTRKQMIVSSRTRPSSPIA